MAKKSIAIYRILTLHFTTRVSFHDNLVLSQKGGIYVEEVVKIESITKAYGTLLAVDHVSLSVKRGIAIYDKIKTQ